MALRNPYSLFWVALPVLLTLGCSAERNRPIALVPAPPPPPAVFPQFSTEVPTYRMAILQLPKPLEPDFDPIQDVIDKAEASFKEGEKAYHNGHLETAKEQFNVAFDTVLQSPVKASEDARLQKEFDSLVDRIHAYEMEAFKQGDGFAEPSYQPSPLDELQTLTFPDNPSEDSQLLGQQAVGSASQVPLVINSQVAGFIDYFTNGRGRGTLDAALQRSGRYRDMMLRILKEEGVPQEFVFLSQVESGFQPRARSVKSALGLWQFISSTGQLYGLEHNWWMDERLNPEEATRAAARHLRDLYNEFGDWYLAMAAYNCGEGCVQKAVERTGYADFWELSRLKVLPQETRNYVPAILALMIIGKTPQKYGIDDLQVEPALQYDTVTVTSPIDLRLVAEIVDTDVETIQQLNPDLLRMTTPNVPEYTLRIPLATRDLFLKRVALIPPEERVLWRWHTVRYGETLSGIARQFKTSVNAIAEINNLEPGQALHEATELVIPIGAEQPDAGSPAVAERRHRVAAGETLASIAKKYHVGQDQLISWNNLDGPGALHRGTWLIVGEKDTAQNGAPSSSAERHVVRRNETLASVARRYHVTVAELISWNNLQKPSVAAGTSLLVRRPASAPDAEGNSQFRVHRVRKGESLAQIAANYDVPLELLRKSNQHLGEVLRVGDSVYIPATK